MKNKILCILNAVLLICFACSERIEQKEISSSGASFADLFTFQDSIVFHPSDSLKSILSLCLDKDENLMICDYIGEKVFKYNIIDSTLHPLADSVDGRKVLMNPLVCTSDENGNIYISSNKNRRILIYDANGSLQRSFLISGGNMTPVSLKAANGYLYMGGYNITTGTLIHKYSIEDGKYIANFLENPKAYNSGALSGTINYPFFDVTKDTIWSTETLDYRLEAFVGDGKSVNRYKIVPDYYQPLSEEIIHEANMGMPFEKVIAKFSKPTFLGENGLKIFVQVEMPNPNQDITDYLKNADYRLDIFEKGTVNECGIECGPKKLIYIDKKSDTFYFLSRMDYKAGNFILERYKYKS